MFRPMFLLFINYVYTNKLKQTIGCTVQIKMTATIINSFRLNLRHFHLICCADNISVNNLIQYNKINK